jgi:error-prone DNA polymerase
VNVSRALCTVEGPEAVRVGLGYVQGVGEAGGTRVEEARRSTTGRSTTGRSASGSFTAGGDTPFRSLFDFMQRTGLSRRATTHLVRVGAFDAFGLNRRELIWQLGLFGGGLAQATLSRPRERQLSMPLPTAQDEIALTDFDPYQRMAADYELLSLSPDSHPMQFLRPTLGEGVASSLHLRALPGGRRVDVAGLVVCRQRPLTAKGIIFLLLEDEFGLVNVLVSRELSERFRDEVRTASFLRVRGVLEQRAGEQRTLIADTLSEIVPAEALRTPSGKSWA